MVNGTSQGGNPRCKSKLPRQIVAEPRPAHLWDGKSSGATTSEERKTLYPTPLRKPVLASNLSGTCVDQNLDTRFAALAFEHIHNLPR